MNVHEIRRRFLAYFGDRGHDVVPSSPLVPQNDPTLFFVNAGMVQFKDVFTGGETRAVPRATSVQRCVRVSGKHNDLENVGRTPRHHTFFEMLGNFSFGDYFKRDAIGYAWDFLTRDLGVDPSRLWVTVYEEDQEAEDIWRSIGFPAARLQKLGAKDNFWSMGETGPCGPCTEIHYDHGPSVSSDLRGPAGGDDRYVEIWNLVFMQFEQRADGTRVNLPRPSIDTGSGLERVAAVLQDVRSNYDTDVFRGLIERASRISGRGYGAGGEQDVAMRVMADHARATAFLVSDGVMPSNEARGYVLRRIMRRAIRFGVKIGIERPFLHDMVDQVASDFRGVYPELTERLPFVTEVVRAEEERFRATLDRGLKLLSAEIERAGRGGTLPGEVAFTLSDTFGFPLDLTELITEEHGVAVDQVGFKSALEAQKERGRAAWKGSGEEAVQGLWKTLAQEQGETSFIGYPSEGSGGTRGEGSALTLVRQHGDQASVVERLEAGDIGMIVLDRTPFYAESGGQVGDTGRLLADSGVFRVDDTSKVSGLHIHRGVVESGAITRGARIDAVVQSNLRAATRRNHTATHLLHAALREVLGEHVTQKGSLVAPDRLRFDFSHHKPVSVDELHAIEDRVNAQILANNPVSTRLMALDAARASGAMALFGERYDEEVRVVSVPGFSTELCGGTHVDRTGDIGLLLIVSESGVAAGVRRIEAQTGAGALLVARGWSSTLHEAADLVKTGADRVLDGIRRAQEDRRRLERELDAARAEIARAKAGDLLSQATIIGGVQVLVARYDGDLREQADRLRDQLGPSLIVLVNDQGGKVSLLAATTKDLAGSRVHAGNLIKELAPLVGGSGGGRPDLAQAGGRDPGGIDTALERARAWAKSHLG